MRRRFIRQDWWRMSRLGKNRKKLQKWRKPSGMHSKMRRKRFGYPISVAIGYKGPAKESGKIKGMCPVLVHNIQELSSLSKDNIVIIARVGAKKKLDIIKKAREMNLKIFNVKEGAEKWNLKKRNLLLQEH